MRLDQLRPEEGSKKKPKRVGRGPGSGHGKTATKGHKGQLARSGGGKRPGFEGGQMPLVRRLPKRGFRPLFRVEYEVVNVGSLSRFTAGGVVTPQAMAEAGLIKGNGKVKILGDGEIEHGLTVRADRFSRKAIEKIEGAGGKGEVIG